MILINAKQKYTLWSCMEYFDYQKVVPEFLVTIANQDYARLRFFHKFKDSF